MKSVDGETSDELAPLVDSNGHFRFETESTALACYAISEDGSLAGVKFVDKTDVPFEVVLHPTEYLHGQLLDADGQGIAGQTIRAIPSIHNPTADRFAASRFSQRMDVPAIQATTDSAGKYHIGPLPRLVPIGLQYKSGPSDTQELDRVFIELDEQRPPATYRIGEVAAPPAKVPISEHMANTLRDAGWVAFTP